MIHGLSADDLRAVKGMSARVGAQVCRREWDLCRAVVDASRRGWSLPERVRGTASCVSDVADAFGHDRGCLPDGVMGQALAGAVRAVAVAVATDAKLPKTVRAAWDAYQEAMHAYWVHVAYVIEFSDC